MRLRLALLLWLASGFAGTTIHAEIHRCTGIDGEPLFSQHPCGPDSTIVVLPPAAAAEAATGLRPGERAWLTERAAARKSHDAAQRKASSTAGKRTPKAQQRQAYQCQRKRHALDAVKAKLRRGYKPAQGETLRRRRQAYDDYLDAYCS